MTREEAIAAGIEVHETKHSMKRRTPWHNYSRRGTYMLTLVVRDRAALLGTLRTTKVTAESPAASSTGAAERAYVELSAVGKAIVEEEIKKINHFHPQVEVWKLCIMPDHLHMIVRVKEDLGAGKHLGMVVRGFKTGCTRAWWRLIDLGEMPTERGQRETPRSGDGLGATVPSASPEGLRPVLFEDGYCDKILLHEGQLDNWKHYLDDNPRRLMMKRLNPTLFTVLSGLEVAGEPCQVVGNRFLLDIPDKMAVVVHRRYTDEENARLRAEWLACGERGGVLVSDAISPKEKAVMREAMNLGYNIILLRENGFPKLYKPSGEAFDACAEGRLLQISPWSFHMERKVISREQCLHLNALAERIAAPK